MYFNNDIMLNEFKNVSHFNNHLNYLFRTDRAQKWTNEHTPYNECYTMTKPDDIGVFRYDLKAREDIKNIFLINGRRILINYFLLEWNAHVMTSLSGMKGCIRKCRQ